MMGTPFNIFICATPKLKPNTLNYNINIKWESIIKPLSFIFGDTKLIVFTVLSCLLLTTLF